MTFVCLECGGKRQVYDPARRKYFVCPLCKGTGIRGWS